MSSVLRQRVITALVLVGLLVPIILLASPQLFALFMMPVFFVAFFEWSRLAGLDSIIAKTVFLFVSTTLMFALYYLMQLPVQGNMPYQNLYSRLELLFASSALLWLLAFSWVLTYPVSTRYWKSRPTMVVLGWLMLLPAWVGLVYLKQARPDGALIFLAILVIAIADIGAYFTGRRWGKRKLAVRVSPGKSWEGFWGGFTANLVFAFLLSVFLQLAFFKACLLMVVLGFASVASVIGDLAESMFKRDAGVKDSGTILPGHGGVLDRIDGWMAAIPILALAHLLFVRPGAL